LHRNLDGGPSFPHRLPCLQFGLQLLRCTLARPIELASRIFQDNFELFLLTYFTLFRTASAMTLFRALNVRRRRLAC